LIRTTILGTVIGILVAVPAFAQEEGGGGDGAAGVGRDQAQVFTRVDTLDPMDQVRTFLGKANIKLSGDQEKTLKPQVDAALKEAQEVTERLAPQGGERGERGQRGAGGNGGGQRRGGPAGPAGFGPNNALTAELRRINDDLIAKINAVLKPDQQAAFKKFRNDEIRKAGGFPALKLVMEEAGAAFAPEQEQQIRELYAEDARLRGQIMRESQGRPDPAKLDELEKRTLTKVARLLNAAQRKALLDSRTKAAQ
jgi:hypothetical protein